MREMGQKHINRIILTDLLDIKITAWETKKSKNWQETSVTAGMNICIHQWESLTWKDKKENGYEGGEG